MTSLAGVFFAFYYNNLFPEQIFHISRSIEIILGPIIGGIGTLFGPLVGALLLTGLAEGIAELMLQLGIDDAGREAGVLRRGAAAGGDVPARGRLAAARAGSSSCDCLTCSPTSIVEIVPRPAGGARGELRGARRQRSLP